MAKFLMEFLRESYDLDMVEYNDQLVVFIQSTISKMFKGDRPQFKVEDPSSGETITSIVAKCVGYDIEVMLTKNDFVFLIKRKDDSKINSVKISRSKSFDERKDKSSILKSLRLVEKAVK
jgi:hypothetical protein